MAFLVVGSGNEKTELIRINLVYSGPGWLLLGDLIYRILVVGSDNGISCCELRK